MTQDETAAQVTTTGGEVGQTESARSLRLFVAIELPDTWKKALESMQGSVQRALARDPYASQAKVRWVRPEGVHLTLKFLGHVAPELLPDIEQAIAVATAGMTPLDLTLGKPGYFARRSRVTVIWEGVDGDTKALADLARRIDAGCLPLGFEPEKRPLAPHLTLARVPETEHLFTAHLEPLLKNVGVAKAPALSASYVSLMRSYIQPGGARYEELGRFPRR